MEQVVLQWGLSTGYYQTTSANVQVLESLCDNTDIHPQLLKSNLWTPLSFICSPPFNNVKVQRRELKKKNIYFLQSLVALLFHYRQYEV